jgi:hypothetical protein
VKRRRHVEAIARLVAEEVARASPRTARRLGRELAAVAFALDPVHARELGGLALVERCRNGHLASLGADDGLVVLGISWQEVVTRAAGYRVKALSP